MTTLEPRIVMGLVYISFPLYVMATKPFGGLLP